MNDLPTSIEPVSPDRVTRLPPFAQSLEQIREQWGIASEQGLNESNVQTARKQYGVNQLVELPPAPLWRKFIKQFQELVIWILLVAAILSGAMGEWVDALAIIAIVILNSVIGFLQEERAEQALAALQKMSAPLAKVFRKGMLRSLPAVELVPGDMLELEAGDNIPADVRLLSTFGFSLQESALTGESVPVEKDASVVLAPGISLGDRRNMAYLGTIAATGKASALVIATGMNTELGKIAGLLQHNLPESTPLQLKLAELGRILIYACLVIVAMIFALQLMRGEHLFPALLLAVSLAVAAVPEGLPAVVTVTLAIGLQRMVKRNALIRRLPSVETLGAVTVICSDKTGTLTRNEMTVREMVVGEAHYAITGAGYTPHGEFHYWDEISSHTESAKVASPATLSDLTQALTIAAWCNNARLNPPTNGDHTWQVIGDPTEGALLVVAMKAGISAANQRCTVIYEIPFDSTRKAMSVVVRDENGKIVMYTKGAPEVVLGNCVSERIGNEERPLSQERTAFWLQTNSVLASRALRVLALAYRQVQGDNPESSTEQNLVFAGLVGMMDPPREEAKLAVETCRQAGIRPVMITGDHPATAIAIARELGIALGSDKAVTGLELDAMNEDQLTEQVEQIAVYARVSAEHKLRVVNAWKSRKHIVAMTGDGVNDAPAIKAADIGIAMGIAGTDVTKEASDMVLIDDNFASIVNAVEEGRSIYDNIQKVLQFLLSCNFGEILLMFVASLLGWPAPLLPIQLLWINLVTDGLPALALSLEPPEPGVMRRKPRSPNESLLSWRISWPILFQGLLVGGVALVSFGFSYLQHPDLIDEARAMTFCVVVYAELFRALAARSQTLTWGQLGFFSNPMLLVAIFVSGLLQIGIVIFPFTQPVFSVANHSALEWLFIACLALTPVSVMEITKLISARFVAPSRAH